MGQPWWKRLQYILRWYPSEGGGWCVFVFWRGYHLRINRFI